VRFLRSKKGMAAIGVLLLLALFLVRPGANRLRARIVSSISLAVGRPVEVSYVSLRLLPRPGFDLQNFVVYDDPAFSAEPVIRAPEVTALLRIRSLLRGKLEIARLSLTEPSLNLVRNDQGRWNIEALVQRASSIPVAPTSKASGETRPGFPYIEAESGRINFKFGQEKKPYALTDADFALWQDSENTWGMRLSAQPTRTDFNLSDTGVLHVDGSWQRAASLRDTPLRFNLLWERGQLGQLTKLAYGEDQGWRGAVQISSLMLGTPAALKITTAAAVQDFRRYDVLGGAAMRLAARCFGMYSSVDRRLSDLDCSSPVGTGRLTAEGSITGLETPRDYDLRFAAHDVPLQSLAALALRAGGSLPHDLTAAGKVNASLRLARVEGADDGPRAEGSGETSAVRLVSGPGRDLALAPVHFLMAQDSAHGGLRVELSAFNVALGKTAPVAVRGRLDRSGYALQVWGEAELRRLLQAAQLAGLPVPPVSAEGAAKVDLQIAGAWRDDAPPGVTGKAQLRAVRADVAGLTVPLEISAADLTLAQNEIKVQGLTGSLGGSAWHGSLQLPRQCVSEEKCPVRFNLAADNVDTTALARLVTASPQIPWYRFLSSSVKPRVPFLAALRASGKLTAGRLTIHGLTASRVSADAQLDAGKLQLANLRADVMGGTHRGEWTADFTAQPPAYRGSGTFDHVALAQLSMAMHDGWVTGTASGRYEVAAFGSMMPQLLTSASGHLEVQARDGSLPHLVLAASGPQLRVNRFAGNLLLHDGQVEISDGKLDAPSGIYEVSGTVSLAKTWNLQLTRDGSRTINVTGTLTTPRVLPATAPETRAALKP
jgi:uncharacterized protein involved in outer membrane biogenesis